VEFEIIQGPKGLHAVEICAACAATPEKAHDETHETKRKAEQPTQPKKKQTA
jgi:CspA family cold shock protein